MNILSPLRVAYIYKQNLPLDYGSKYVKHSHFLELIDLWYTEGVNITMPWGIDPYQSIIPWSQLLPLEEGDISDIAYLV